LYSGLLFQKVINKYMPEKQLNFLNIFEPSKHEIENIDKDDVEDEEEQSIDTEAQGTEEKKEEDLISDSLIKREEKIKKEAEIKLKRLRLLQTNREIPLSDFEDIMPEIKAYEIRLAMLRAIYENATPGPDKQKAYQKLVNPDLYDEEMHRDSARLYLKYLDSLKSYQKKQLTVNNQKARKDKNKKLDPNSIEYKMKKIKDYKPGHKDASARNFD